MSERPTPETDAARHDLSDYGPPVLCSWGDWVEADFARKLERERDEARERERVALNAFDEERQRASREGERVLEARRERDEAREEWGKASMDAAQLLSEKTYVIAERDEAREAMREAWLACMRVDVRLALVEWQNKHANILEGAK